MSDLSPRGFHFPLNHAGWKRAFFGDSPPEIKFIAPGQIVGTQQGKGWACKHRFCRGEVLVCNTYVVYRDY